MARLRCSRFCKRSSKGGSKCKPRDSECSDWVNAEAGATWLVTVCIPVIAQDNLGLWSRVEDVGGNTIQDINKVDPKGRNTASQTRDNSAREKENCHSVEQLAEHMRASPGDGEKKCGVKHDTAVVRSWYFCRTL